MRLFPKIFLLVIYYTYPSPKLDSQSISLSRRVLGRRYPPIMCECDRTHAILIRPLIHPLTCEMSSFIFASVIRHSMADSTVPVNVVPRTVFQEPVCLERRNRRQSKALRVSTIPSSLALLMSSWFFLPSLLSYLIAV